MLDAMPLIWDFFKDFVVQYWDAIMASSVLSAFVALAVLNKVFHIFDIIKR